MFGTNEGELDDIFLDASKIYIAKEILLSESKNTRKLFLSLLKANKMYFIGTFISNELIVFPTVLDSMSSHSYDP